MSTNSNCYEKQKLRGLKRKYESIVERGSRCQNCGYNKNISALEYHHIDPSTKSFQVDVRAFSNTTPEKLLKELDKCILICANCHREIHNKDLSLDNIPKLIENLTSDTLQNLGEKQYSSICPTCKKSFKKVTGKIFCSKECRMAEKKYPTKEEIKAKYKELAVWTKVAEYFNISRKVLQKLRKNYNID